MIGREPKRTKVEELAPENACALMQWLIDNWQAYNSPVSRRSNKGGSIKHQFWVKWAAQLEALGDTRNAEQIKKKINGELAFVRKRIAEENDELCITGEKKAYGQLSESRRILYEFLKSNDSVEVFVAGEELDTKDPDILKMDVGERIYVNGDNETSICFKAKAEGSGYKEKLRSNERNETTDAETIATLFHPIVKEEGAHSYQDDASEQRKELLRIELETAKIKNELARQELKNAQNLEKKIQMEMENVRRKRLLLVHECNEKGYEVVDSVDSNIL